MILSSVIVVVLLFLELQTAYGQGIYLLYHPNSNNCVAPPGALSSPPVGPYNSLCLTLSIRVTWSAYGSPAYRSLRVQCSPKPTITAYNEGSCAGSPVHTFPAIDGDLKTYCLESTSVSYRLLCAPPPPNCLASLDVSRNECNKRIKECGSDPYIGLKWAPGCRATNGKSAQKDGCRCREYCGYTCQNRCLQDPDCAWNANLNACTHKTSPDIPAEETCRPLYFLTGTQSLISWWRKLRKLVFHDRLARATTALTLRFVKWLLLSSVTFLRKAILLHLQTGNK